MGQDNDMALVTAESLYRRYEEGKIENLNSTRLIIWLVDVCQDSMTGGKKQLRSQSCDCLITGLAAPCQAIDM